MICPIVPVSLTKCDMVTDKSKWKHSFDKRYDMVTDIPNAYFVEVGIYKWHGSPTYTLGRWAEEILTRCWIFLCRTTSLYLKQWFARGTRFGAALHYRSLPMFFAAIVDLVLINLFNRSRDQREFLKFEKWKVNTKSFHSFSRSAKWKKNAFTLFREVQSEIKMLSLFFEKWKVKSKCFEIEKWKFWRILCNSRETRFSNRFIPLKLKKLVV